MARGLALVVGLKEVDPGAYGGRRHKDGCEGCELDVAAMAAFLEDADLKVTTLTTEEAKRSAILGALTQAARTMDPGQLFVFYFSGHGRQILDTSQDENDGWDETMMAYDGELSDDDLFQAWQAFPSGVRIVSVADACHSGSLMDDTTLAAPRDQPHIVPLTPRAASKMRAPMIHIGAAMDGTAAKGGKKGSLFSTELLKILSSFPGPHTYHDLFDRLKAKLLGKQRPVMLDFGKGSDVLMATRPFT